MWKVLISWNLRPWESKKEGFLSPFLCSPVQRWPVSSLPSFEAFSDRADLFLQLSQESIIAKQHRIQLVTSIPATHILKQICHAICGLFNMWLSCTMSPSIGSVYSHPMAGLAGHADAPFALLPRLVVTLAKGLSPVAQEQAWGPSAQLRGAAWPRPLKRPGWQHLPPPPAACKGISLEQAPVAPWVSSPQILLFVSGFCPAGTAFRTVGGPGLLACNIQPTPPSTALRHISQPRGSTPVPE